MIEVFMEYCGHPVVLSGCSKQDGHESQGQGQKPLKLLWFTSHLGHNIPRHGCGKALDYCSSNITESLAQGIFHDVHKKESCVQTYQVLAFLSGASFTGSHVSMIRIKFTTSSANSWSQLQFSACHEKEHSRRLLCQAMLMSS